MNEFIEEQAEIQSDFFEIRNQLIRCEMIIEAIQIQGMINASISAKPMIFKYESHPLRSVLQGLQEIERVIVSLEEKTTEEGKHE